MGPMLEDHPSAPSAAAPNGPSVLVVDDDAIVRQAIVILLEDHGFRVATAVDGADALRKFRQSAPDAVLTDIVMPNKEGIELIMELRRERPDARIIAMSGGGTMATSNFVLLATTLGADIGLRKPFDDLELIAAIDSLTRAPAAARAA
jgi:CheY-like chemotaxis protein